MLLLANTPCFRLEDATAMAAKLYGLNVSASPLPSERDQNFLLETGIKDKFVLKIANALEQRALLEAQNAALAHLSHSISFCPRIIPTISGEEIAEAAGAGGQINLVRMMTYLPGTPLAEIDSP